MAYWLYKSEPFKWSWQMQKDAGEAGTEWTGVRNYLARNHLRAMTIGDKGFFYHSNEGLEVVGITAGCALSHPDSTAGEDPRWDCQHVARHLHASFGAAGDRGRVDRGLPHGRSRQAAALMVRPFARHIAFLRGRRRGAMFP